MVLASPKTESKIFVVDVCSLPLERGVKFSIDLVPSIGPISIALYRILEANDLLEKDFASLPK
ncbi:hypothetical protein CR513_38068, partial [Mucuna pruriens]